MQKARLWQQNLSVFLLSLLLLIVGVLIVFHAPDFYLLQIKGDPAGTMFTADIILGPVPLLFWILVALYLWLASTVFKVPIQAVAKPGVLMGLLLHLVLLLFQLELEYPATGSYSSPVYYFYMRGIFLLLFFSLGAFSSLFWKQIKSKAVERESLITRVPFLFLFFTLLLFFMARIPWFVVGIAGLLFGLLINKRIYQRAYRQWMVKFPLSRVLLPILFLFVFFTVTAFGFKLINTYGENFPNAGDDRFWDTHAKEFATNTFHNVDIAMGYIIFLGILYKLLGANYHVAVLIQAFLASCSVLLLYAIARKLFSPSVGLVAAALLALNGPFLNISSTLSTEGLYTFLVLLLFWSLLQYKDTSQNAYLILGAFAFVAAEVTKPQTLLFIIPVLIWLFLVNKKEQRKKPFLFFIWVVIFMVPFTLYDINVNEKFTLFHAGGERAYINIMGQELNETGINPYTNNAAQTLKNIIQKFGPLSTIMVEWIPKKFLRFFFSSWYGTFDFLLLHRFTVFANQLRFYAYLAVLFGSWLLWKNRKRIKEQWKDQLLVFSFIPYTTIIILLASTARVRYRLPLDPLFMILIAVALVWLFQRKKT